MIEERPQKDAVSVGHDRGHHEDRHEHQEAFALQWLLRQREHYRAVDHREEDLRGGELSIIRIQRL